MAEGNHSVVKNQWKYHQLDQCRNSDGDGEEVEAPNASNQTKDRYQPAKQSKQPDFEDCSSRAVLDFAQNMVFKTNQTSFEPPIEGTALKLAVTDEIMSRLLLKVFSNGI